MTKPTERELEILQILWSSGPSTVREVHTILSEKGDLGYTTALKLMQIMFEKGFLDRTKSGKTHTYFSLIKQEDASKQMVDKLMSTIFEGSATKLVMQALGNRKSSVEELRKIKSFIEKLENEADNE